MLFKKIANSSLEVSSICLGSWVFGGEGWGEVSDDQSSQVIEKAIHEDINFIDTAPVYGDGHAEEVIGRALKSTRRDRIIIATKCGLERKGHSIRTNLSASFIRKEIENSLRRLGIEVVDLYQCHWPDPNTPLEETFTELNKLVKEGKIRYIGVSNFDKKLLEDATEFAPVVSNQVQYSIFERKIEKDLVPFCKEKNVSILSYGTLGGGILTGKYKEPPIFPKGDVRTFFYQYYREPFWGKAKKIIATLEEIAKKRKVPIPQVAVNWVLSHSEATSCIVGCRTPEQLDENIRAVDWGLNNEELMRL